MSKSFFLLLTAVFLSSIVSAQNIAFGVRTRYTLAKFHGSIGKVNTNTDNVKNVDLGIFIEKNYNQISFQSGLELVQKGGSGVYDYMTTGYDYEESFSEIKVNYLEVPLNILYNFNLKPGKLFVGGGPYFGYGLSGKAHVYSISYTTSGGSVTDKHDEAVNFGSAAEDMRRVDFGLNALIGFRLTKGFEANFGYGLGLGNLGNVSGITISNRTLSIGVGYFFK